MVSYWKKFKQKFYIFFSVYFIYVFIKLIFFTCKKRYLIGKLPKDKGSVVLFWHGQLGFMCFVYKCIWDNVQKHGKVIISDHKDGEIITKIIDKFGIGTLRGSSSKGGAKVLIDALRQIKQGTDIVITPDGPRGPRHSVADGAVVISQKTNSDIYVLNYEIDNFWELKSWDKMIIPKPFSTIKFTLSKPFNVKDLSLSEAKRKIQLQMWQESSKNGGKSIKEHESDFRLNLKKWWDKNSRKNYKLDDDLMEILNGD